MTKFYQLCICPICGEDLRYGLEAYIDRPTPSYLAEVLSAHYDYHNLENMTPVESTKRLR